MNNEIYIEGEFGNTVIASFNDEILSISIQHISENEFVQSIVSEQLGLVGAIELRTIIDNYINNQGENNNE